MRIFLDANILFSAAKSDGAIRQLLSSLIQRRHELWADAYVVEEARRNLEIKAPAGVPELIRQLERVRMATATGTDLNPRVRLAQKDRPVLASAIRSGCEVLVTGDRTHFAHLYGKVVEGVEILTPAALALKL